MNPNSERDENLSKSNASVASQNDALVAAFDSAIIAKVHEQRHEEGRDVINIDDAYERKFLDTVCTSPKKTNGPKVSKSQNQAKISGSKSLNITRRRRNICSKPAQPSVWRLLGNSLNGSEQSDRVEIVQHEPRESRRANGGQESNQTGQRSQKPMGKNHISLKVKFGNRCLMDVLPLIENGNGIYSSTGKEPSKSADDINEEFTRTMGLDGLNRRLGNSLMLSDGSVSNPCLAGNSLVENQAKESLECHPELPTEMDLEKLGTPVDSRCSDPGTSPDSEVINVIPDASISLKGIEYLPDLIPNQECFSSRDISSLDAQEKGLKKGKKKNWLNKKDRLDKTSDISVKGTLPGLKILNNELVPNMSNYGDSSALTTIGNTSGNVFSTELHSEEPLPSSRLDDFGISNAISEFELGEKVDLCCLYTESPESQMTEKPLSSPDKLKLPKTGRYQGVGKSESGICNSSRREYAFKWKGNKEKIVGKRDEKEKTQSALGLSEVKNNPNTENQTPPNLEENGSRNGNMGVCVSNQSDMGTNYVLPRNAWVQCDDCHKWRRISVSLADKIEETDCSWSCKDNMDSDFADCSIPQEKSNAEINVELEISDMSEEEDAFDACHNSDNSGKKSAVAHSSTWTLIKSNLFLHRSRKSQTIDEIMICHCKPPSDGRIGCGNGCLNRMLNIECVQGTCPCGNQCSNQQFQRRNYAKMKWFKCGKKGYGLKLLEDVSKGCFIIEYVGEVLDMRAYEGRQKEYALKGHKHFYFMTLNGSEVIDACAKGNLGRFINHSCDPNCRTEKWMVNGEVCIGLFAIRAIKKGEELTFDYNYVRVFGAAAKKCVCGSPQCRGYIGGDPQNAEVIVQDDSDDEYPEPVVICEEDDMHDELNNIKSTASSFRGAEMRSAKEPAKNTENVFSAECLKATEENADLLNISSLRVDTSMVLGGSGGLLHTSSPSEDITSETICEAKQECTGAQKDLERSLCSPVELEVTSPAGTLSKPSRKSKSGKVGCKVPFIKTPRSSQKKSTSVVVNVKTLAEMDKSNMLQDKPKKLAEGSLNNRFEAVEEKLNELLDLNGGISKSKDASRSYLKLLLLTAASGDSGNSEAIQSNRELSMILGALLKTKSRTVLVDIINKNGLQMLHNIMKRYRREFNKTPILRKLLKVLEYLALREILTIDHINGVPSRPGVESFRDSILALTEHMDKQVHQISRNFRDRWIPKPLRKNSCMERDDERVEFHTGSLCDRSLSLQNHSVGCCKRPSETVGCITRDGRMPDGSSGLGISNAVKKTRKRKSRWDQVPEINDNGLQDRDDGAPPGYEVPPGLIIPKKEHCSAKQPVIGQCQHRFISGLLVSYGIPSNIVQQFGIPLNGSSENWGVAPGIPFHPFPPLPTYSHDRRDDTQTPLPSYPCDKINPSAANEALAQPTKTSIQDSLSCTPCHSAHNPSSTSEANLYQDGENAELDHQHSGVSYCLGRKYFRQQKWNAPKLGPPWLQMRNGQAPPTGINSKSGICNVAGQSATIVNQLRSWSASEEKGTLGYPSHQS